MSGSRLDLIESILLEPQSIRRGFFKPAAIKKLFAERRAKHRDHYDRIWRVLNLELWHRVCLEGDKGGISLAEPSEAKLMSSIA